MTKHRDSHARSPQWWKHLRDWKRVFWKRDRVDGRPAHYRLLCTNCAPGDDWFSEYTGPCDECGGYRPLMVLRLVSHDD